MCRLFTSYKILFFQSVGSWDILLHFLRSYTFPPHQCSFLMVLVTRVCHILWYDENPLHFSHSQKLSKPRNVFKQKSFLKTKYILLLCIKKLLVSKCVNDVFVSHFWEYSLVGDWWLWGWCGSVWWFGWGLRWSELRREAQHVNDDYEVTAQWVYIYLKFKQKYNTKMKKKELTKSRNLFF